MRTFQINSLFPHLNPLEAVTLVICERDKIARTFWRTTADYHAAVDEAYEILKSLLLAPVCTRETRELAYGQQRLLEIALALATKPKVLLLDEPAAGVPRDESAELFTAINSLSKDITVLFIEHDMELVFRLASRIIVMVSGGILLKGSPAEIAADPRVREVYLGGAAWLKQIRLTRCSPSRTSRSGYGEAVVLDDISFDVPERGSLAVLGRNGVGKSTLLLTLMGFTQLRRGAIIWRGRDISRLAPHRRAQAGIGWVAQEREIFANLTVEENLTVAARPGRWDLDAAYRFFPRLEGAPAVQRATSCPAASSRCCATARALMTNPSLLLLDEPLEGLAPIIVEELVRGLRKMIVEEGTAVILVEQHAEVALSLTEHALLLERGTIVHSRAVAGPA